MSDNAMPESAVSESASPENAAPETAAKPTMMTVDRRRFIASGLALGAALRIGFDAEGALASDRDGLSTFNPFVAVDEDGSVVAIVKHFEMGQGTTTGLPTLIAEELDADWASLRVVFAPADNLRYKNLLFGAQGTGGSTAIANSWEQYRKAAAAARDALVRAAARRWGVDPGRIRVENGVLIADDGRRTGFGAVAKAAAALPVAAEPKLKPASAFRYIGNRRLPRKDNDSKTDGSAVFAFDVSLPPMVYALIKRPPRFGGRLRSFDAAAARAVDGFVDAKALPNAAGVVVYGRDAWSALQAREALTAQWNEDEAETRDSAQIVADHLALLDAPHYSARPDADRAQIRNSIAQSPRLAQAEFTFPFLAHAPMEPLNCTVAPDGEGGVRLYDGCQFPAIAQPTVAAILGLKPEQVAIETVYAGGSFGRRATPSADYPAEAAFAFALMGKRRPVKLIWSREDDIQGGYYRPMAAHRVRIGLDHLGAIAGWDHCIAAKSIIKGTPFESVLVHEGVDHSSVEGVADSIYAIPNMYVGLSDAQTPIPVLWWRSVGHSHTAYVMETAMDMAAEAAGAEPVSFRLNLLPRDAEDGRRMAKVLYRAANAAGWFLTPPPGRYRGVACHKSFNSYVAQVAEISLTEDGAVKLERMVCAVDCGIAVNPDVIEAQMQSAVGYALGAVMRNEITLSAGIVDQSNFPDYEPLRMSEMPQIEVHIIASEAAPTGIGEPGTPPAGPALANAIYAATGKRVTSLPMTAAGIRFA